MPVDFCHQVKALRTVCHSDSAYIHFAGKSVIIWTFSETHWFNFIWLTWQIFTISRNKWYHVIPTKCRTYRDHRLCDVTSPDVCTMYTLSQWKCESQSVYWFAHAVDAARGSMFLGLCLCLSHTHGAYIITYVSLHVCSCPMETFLTGLLLTSSFSL